jgi:tetratricopeptide (TPR) repeat protein
MAIVLSTAAEPAPTIEERKASARASIDREDFRGALEQAEAINHTVPDDVAGYQLLADAQIGLGDYTEAEKQLQWMLDLRIGKTDAAGWLLLARFREHTGDLEGALEGLASAGATVPPSETQQRRRLLLYAGRLYREGGKLEQAASAARAVLAGSAADPDATVLLAQVCADEGKPEEAVRLVRRLPLAKLDPRLLYSVAEITRAPADYLAFERGALGISAASRNANRELVLYYAGAGRKPARALEIARREAEQRHDIFTLDALAVALYASHQAAEARDTMSRVLAVGTRNPEILRHAARIGVKAA